MSDLNRVTSRPFRLAHRRLSAWLLALGLAATASVAAELHSYAFVEDDGTLRISNTRVHLYGIYIPPTGRHCNRFQRPIVCAPRAALALDFKIDGFVRCEIIERHPDRSVTGRCRVDELDLSAYLLEQGWALARPEAPFEYQALERIARHHNRGGWGRSVDRIRPKPLPPTAP